MAKVKLSCIRGCPDFKKQLSIFKVNNRNTQGVEMFKTNNKDTRTRH